MSGNEHGERRHTQDIECPLCKAASRDNAANWGVAHTENGVERPTYWCKCGRMVWMSLSGWLVTYDFVINLAKAFRSCTPTQYREMMLTLLVIMPSEHERIRKEIES